jgi:hypothetical protein
VTSGVVAAPAMVVEAVMLTTNMAGRVIAAVTSLRDTGSRDRSHGDNRDESLRVASVHYVLPFLDGVWDRTHAALSPVVVSIGPSSHLKAYPRERS